MLVQDLMVRDVATISPMATIRAAMQVMKNRRVKSLAVERRDAHDVHGIITYTNILKTIVAEEGDIDLINVYDICAKPAITISAQAHVKHATILPASGISQSPLKTFFGLTFQASMTLLFWIADCETANRVAQVLNDELDLQSPQQGLALTMPIDRLYGLDLAG